MNLPEQQQTIDAALPSFIEETDPYLPDPAGADLVLDYLLHPDLNLALAEKCKQAGIPLIASVKTLRDAPCGATWDAGQRIIGYSVEEVPVRIGLETQFYCVADPASWDPITGKSPVHIAGELRKAALLRALKMAVVPSEKEKISRPLRKG